MLPNMGPTQLIIILAIVLVFFGAKRIPELAKGLGSGMREFNRGKSGDYDEEIEEERKKKDDEDLAGEEDSSKKDNSDSKLQEDASEEAERAERKN